jgi:hypothetical protein
MTRIVIEIEVPTDAEEGFKQGKRAFVVPLSETETVRLGTDVIVVHEGLAVMADSLVAFVEGRELYGKPDPEELIFGLLRSGFTANCYDGQFFFDVDHPVLDPVTDTVINVSNTQTGAGPAWYLLDTSQPVKPLIWQEREPYTFEQQTNPGDDAVFMNNDYTYGVRARVNAGYGHQDRVGC